MLCNGTIKTCISKKHLCDGIKHCPSGEDELNCPGACKLNLKEFSANDTNKNMVICSDDKEYHWKYACGGNMEICQGNCTKCNLETAFDCNAKTPEKPKFRECISRDLVRFFY